MNIIKEKRTIDHSYIAELENGVTLIVFGSYAKGSDGKTYYHVGKEDEEGDLELLGWSCDVDCEVITESKYDPEYENKVPEFEEIEIFK